MNVGLVTEDATGMFVGLVESVERFLHRIEISDGFEWVRQKTYREWFEFSVLLPSCQ